MSSSFCFAGYPAAVLYSADGQKAVSQKLWGSRLELTGNTAGNQLEVKAGRRRLWVDRKATQTHPVLEVMFLDIGQGDSCLVSLPTAGPQPRKFIIDAGGSDNLIRFLNHKYRLPGSAVSFEAFIITHPDEDHYAGFSPLLQSESFNVDTIYHSGITDRGSSGTAGGLGKKLWINGKHYLTEVTETKTQLQDLLAAQKAAVGSKLSRYLGLMDQAAASGRVGDIRMLSVNDGYLPGCGPSDNVTIQVLAPIPEAVAGGKPAYRWFGDVGKTKNGHSVVLRLVYGQVSLLLGGDLNIPAEEYLLEHYTGYKLPAADSEEEAKIVTAGRRVFQSDFAKACHHGSADFTEVFLQAVNALGTVISSGDDESFAHPRADTLGTVGKYSRGRRSLIFSTELARSTRETVKNAALFRERLRAAAKAVEVAGNGGNQKSIDAAEKRFSKLLEQIERSVTTFGAINLRTDGKNVVFAYRIENPRGPASQWDIYQFTRNSAGDLVFDSKH